MSRPSDLRYTATHEWVRVSGDETSGLTATVGITDFAVAQLSDLAFVDLPATGKAVKKGARFGEIESTKAVSDLVAPVSGTVVAVNGDVAENLALISNSPFGDGWLVRIRLTDPSELKALLSAQDYEAVTQVEEH